MSQLIRCLLSLMTAWTIFNAVYKHCFSEMRTSNLMLKWMTLPVGKFRSTSQVGSCLDIFTRGCKLRCPAERWKIGTMRMLAQVVVQLALLQLKVPGKYRTKLLFNVSHVFIRTLYNQYIYIYIYSIQYSTVHICIHTQYLPVALVLQCSNHFSCHLLHISIIH